MTENNGDNKDCVTGNGAFLSMNTPSRPIIAIIGCCDWEWGQQHQHGHLWPRVPETQRRGWSHWIHRIHRIHWGEYIGPDAFTEREQALWG